MRFMFSSGVNYQFGDSLRQHACRLKPGLLTSAAMEAPGAVPESINCHNCNARIDLTGQQGFTHVECAKCGALSVVPLQFGNLLLLNALGIGGMGTVYKAIDLQLNRYVAVKILRAKFAADPNFIETFTREARAAAAVNHPNVAQVYSFAQHDGQYFLTMELLERGSLDDRITKLGKVPEADVLEIGAAIAAGLRAAHQRGLLHRDIKPGNILFNDEGVAKIVDFGLAGAQHESAAQQAPEGGTVVWGTPYYIAPEKLRGQPEDFRSDMYSLGATLFHALAGRPPFDAKTASEVVTKHATTPALNLKTYVPGVQDPTAHVIGRMLAKEPTERYETHDALIHDFQVAIKALKEAAATPVLVTETGQRVPVLSIIASLAAVLAATLVIIFLWVHRDKFGLESSSTNAPVPPPPPPAVGTNALSGAKPPADEDVDFTENAPWAKSWHNALLDLAKADYQSTLNECENLKRLTLGRQRHRQWVFFLEGLTLVTAGRSTEAQTSLHKAVDPFAQPQLPVEPTPTNLVDPLAFVLLGRLPVADALSGLEQRPAWVTALVQLVAGIKQVDAGELEAARRTLRAAQQVPVDAAHRWAFALQPLADRLAREIEGLPAFFAKVDEQIAAGQFDAATKALRDQRNKTRIAAYRQQIAQREAAIVEAQKQASAEAEAARQAAEAERRAAEARQREAEEQARRLAETEVQQVAAQDSQLAATLQAYDFKGAERRLNTLAPKLETAAGQQALERRRAGLRLLQEFKAQLIADIPGRPFDAAKLITRPQVKVQGKLVRATETQLIFELPYGEMTADWRDVTPAGLVKVAEFYAGAAVTAEKPAAQARRQLWLAVFATEFKLPAESYRKQAEKLDPAIAREFSALAAP
jgi:serine/threonine protein kinase